MGNEVYIIDVVDLEGAEVLPLARAQIKKLKALNVNVPKMEAQGDWLLNGVPITLEEFCDAKPPLGNKFLRVKVSEDHKPAQLEPTDGSTIRLHFVFSGEELDADDPRVEESLF